MNKQNLIFVGIGLVILGGLFLFASSPSQLKAVKTNRTSREIALTCAPEMTQGFHIHPVLEIIVNGEKVVIPANIGISATCLTAIHTHTADGVIHIESPEKRDFTLGDFFAVWNQPFSKDQILTNKADASHKITVTVDGTQVDTYENTILTDKEHVIIQYGSK